jgi:hypothetical protein
MIGYHRKALALQGVPTCIHVRDSTACRKNAYFMLALALVLAHQ